MQANASRYQDAIVLASGRNKIPYERYSYLRARLDGILCVSRLHWCRQRWNRMEKCN